MNPAPPVIRILSKSGIRLDEKLSYIFAGIYQQKQFLENKEVLLLFKCIFGSKELNTILFKTKLFCTLCQKEISIMVPISWII